MDKELVGKIAKLEAEIEALRRERIGEVWYWQGDGDYLESLTCPVLIEASALRELLKKALKTGELSALSSPNIIEIDRDAELLEEFLILPEGVTENSGVVRARRAGYKQA